MNDRNIVLVMNFKLLMSNIGQVMSQGCAKYSLMLFQANGIHMPYGITQCYLEMGKNPNCSGSVLFGFYDYQSSFRFEFQEMLHQVRLGSVLKQQVVFLYCNLVYNQWRISSVHSTEENVVCFRSIIINFYECVP